jgi:hypothetical protein
VGARFASAAPEIAATAQRLLGGGRVAADLTTGHQGKD